VSSGSSYDTKEQVRRAIDIVDLVGSYLQLRREGRAYKALCPWHHDTRPSLQVNPERQSYKCWVCDIGGDVFSFVMKIEGITFPEALTMLAEKAGIKLSGPSGNDRGGVGGDEKKLLYDAMKWAEEQFHRCLSTTPAAEPARRYLAERGITTDSVERYKLGYAPDEWGWLLGQAKNTRFTPKLLEKVGLVAPKPNGPGHYDRFKGRVLFSIRDAQGRPVAFGGRVLPGAGGENAAKYINSPETPLYSKSGLLYGLDAARDAIAKVRTALVMEGYTDCLIAQQCGFAHAVAACGTALGERHLQLLRRYADRIVLVLDGDEAGRRRTDQLLELFIAEQVDLRILTLPDELDPCDFLRTRGAAAFQALLEQAVDALEHKFRVATAGFTAASDTHAANRALEDVLSTLAKAPRLRDGTSSAVRLKEDQVLQRLAARFAVAEERLRSRLTALRRPSRASTLGTASRVDAQEPPADRPQLVALERELLEIVIQTPGVVTRVRRELSPQEAVSPACQRILSTCYSLSEAGIDPGFDRLILEFDEPEWKNLLVDLEDKGRAKGSGETARLDAVLNEFRWRREDQELRHLRSAVVQGQVDERQGLAALQQSIQSVRSRQGISRSTDG
jgi:DNA primase